MLHHHALVTKTLSKELGDVVAIIVAAVNFIRTRALNHRLFRVFSEDIGAAYTHLLYHIEVCWLSRGQVLNCILQLCQKIEISCMKKARTWWTTLVTLLSLSQGLRTSATFLAT